MFDRSRHFLREQCRHKEKTISHPFGEFVSFDTQIVINKIYCKDLCILDGQ